MNTGLLEPTIGGNHAKGRLLFHDANSLVVETNSFFALRAECVVAHMLFSSLLQAFDVGEFAKKLLKSREFSVS